MPRPDQPEPIEQTDGRGIGEVLRLLATEFADVTVSKIRFLEAEGLVSPTRTGSGYRRFSTADIARLRYVLRAQRDQYLPLKVIREHLDAMDRGLQPTPGGAPVVPAEQAGGLPTAEEFGRTGTELRLTRAEFVAAAGITEALFDQLVSHGLVVARDDHYDGDALLVARTAAEFAGYGIEPRHLRPFRTAADREIGLIDQVRGNHRDTRPEHLAALALRLHLALVRSRLAR